MKRPHLRTFLFALLVAAITPEIIAAPPDAQSATEAVLRRPATTRKRPAKAHTLTATPPGRTAEEDLPRYVEALQKRNVKLLLLTTAITGTASPHAEAILRTARKFGVKYYRLGYWNYQPGKPVAETLNDIKAQLKDLAALNQELGLCAVLQNHAGAERVGAKVWDLYL
jgi:hypothetical protein